MPVNPSDLNGLRGQITPEDILEYCDIRSISQASFAIDKADSQVTFKVPGSKLKAFVLFALGAAYVDQSNYLCRLLPMFHPFWNWLYCTKIISINGEGFDGDDTDAVVWDDQITPAKWKQHVVVCAFDQLPYDVLEDGDAALGAPQDESKRFTSFDLIPNVQLASIENGTITYDANAGDAWNGKPVNAHTLQAKARRETCGVKLRWWNVPAEFVHARNTLPSKLLTIQGTANDATFLGQPAETLLCEDVKFEKFVCPFMTDTAGQLYFAYHIDFTFLWYDPTPKGKTGETRHGWNFALAPGDTALKYYYASTSGGGKVFPTSTFANAFTHY